MIKLFTTKSCSQCPVVKDALKEKEYGAYHLVDAEEEPTLAAHYGIMSVPALVTDEGEVHIGAGACLKYISERGSNL